ncbi:MAG: branched-chain amino acid ABC transporter permease [Defluviitaleaceae bacterium]|nr:branched-chain amino acid ABC transporter permease [Defluviitaleaceae bacterium]
MQNNYKALEESLKPRYFQNAVKHPAIGYILLVVFLISLQMSFMMGIGPITLTISRTIALTMIYTVAAMGLGILVGIAGLVSLGTAAFVGFGAYTAGNLLRTFTGIPFTLVVLIAIAVGVILGAIIGFISLRVRGLYLLVITMGFATVMQEFFQAPNPFTGGWTGITRVPFPTIAMFLQLNRETVFFLVLIIMMILVKLTLNILNSPMGRAMAAMASSEPLAQAMGIQLLKYRVLAFIISTAYATISGVLLVSSLGAATPTSWTFMLSMNLLAVIILGGGVKPHSIMLGAFFVFGMDVIIWQRFEFFQRFPGLVMVLGGILMILIFAKFQGGLTRLINEIRFLFIRLFMKWRVFKYGPEV